MSHSIAYMPWNQLFIAGKLKGVASSALGKLQI